MGLKTVIFTSTLSVVIGGGGKSNYDLGNSLKLAIPKSRFIPEPGSRGRGDVLVKFRWAGKVSGTLCSSGGC